MYLGMFQLVYFESCTVIVQTYIIAGSPSSDMEIFASSGMQIDII
jgi:hypothetical protein